MNVIPESVPLRSGTTAEWAATALILGVGELGLDVTLNVLKAGNGVDAWADLDPVGGGDGTSETAYLVATGIAGATDAGTVHIPLEVDDRFGDPPAWLDINGSGDVDLGLDAGGIFFTALDDCSIDYSGTTPADGNTQVVITAKVNGNQVTSGNTEATGDGEDLQDFKALAVDQTGFGTLAFYAEVSASDSEAAPIADGVVSHDVYVVLKKVIEISDVIEA